MAYPASPAYTASKAQTSQGTGIWINPGNASPPTWTFIGECTGADFSDSAMFDKSTNLQSGAEEFISVLDDPGTLSVTLNRVSTDAGQTALKTAKAGKTRDGYSVVFPINTAAGQTTTGDQRNFLGFVKTLQPKIAVNKIITTKFDVQITNAITEVQGS